MANEQAVKLAVAGRWREAAALNRELIARFGDDAEVYNRLGKAFTELGRIREARAVYEAVLAAQQAAFDVIRPGATLKQIHDAAVRTLVEGMVELGALEGGVDELIESEDYRAFYMHSTGHFLGLDVHDVGQYSIGGEPRPLEPGMCFTVEPGLYFSADGEKTPERLRGIGVRIEDDVVMTEDGYETLTDAIPKRIDQVEAWLRE